MEFSLPLTELLSSLWMMMVNNEAVDIPCMVKSVGFEQWLQDYLVCVLLVYWIYDQYKEMWSHVVCVIFAAICWLELTYDYL